MNLEACLAWAVRHHELDSQSTADVRFVMDALGAPRASGDGRVSHFNACLNTRDLFRVAKLVHVSRNALAADIAERERVADERRAAIVTVLEALNRMRGTAFDVALFDRVCQAIFEAGVSAWYPIVGFEYVPSTRFVPELSFYCAENPSQAAEAASAALGVRDRQALRRLAPRIFAFGFDVLAGGGWRSKPYTRADAGAVPELAVQLPPRLRFRPFVVQERLRPDGTSERPGKAYAELFVRDGSGSPCTAEELVSGARGKLGEFVRDVASALAGQHVFYVGASSEKVEVYLGVEPSADQ